ncbi:MAG: hypothetical protein RLZ55_1335 [Actinomycetota bacterium]|jgi:hypothetical protein
MNVHKSDDMVALLSQMDDAEFTAVFDDVLRHRPRLSPVREEVIELVLLGHHWTDLAGRDTPHYVNVDVGGSSAQSLVRQAAIEREARTHIFGALEMLKAADAGALLAADYRIPRKAANEARKRGILLGLRQGNQFAYPAFQFDLAELRVRPAVAAANKALGALEDPWAVASWWASPSALTATNVSPYELAITGQDDTLTQLVAAEIETV